MKGEVIKREPCRIDEPYNMLHTYYFIKHKEYKVVGIKLRFNFVQTTANTLLGRLCENKSDKKNIKISYHPFLDNESTDVFGNIKNDLQSEMLFPFRFKTPGSSGIQKTGKEGWNPLFAEFLSNTEEHLRKYTKEVFGKYCKPDSIVYDPACSTGQFLHELKQEYNSIFTVGGDLSSEMINYAKDFLDKTECCDAKDSLLEKEFADVIFLRFLNDQVVSKNQAKQILPKVLEKLKPGGIVFAFGFTPVLLTAADFEKNNLEVLQKIAYDSSSDAIFQYYVMRNREATNQKPREKGLTV